MSDEFQKKELNLKKQEKIRKREVNKNRILFRIPTELRIKWEKYRKDHPEFNQSAFFKEKMRKHLED